MIMNEYFPACQIMDFCQFLARLENIKDQKR